VTEVYDSQQQGYFHSLTRSVKVHQKYQLLKHYFGHDAFRPLQEEGVDTVLDGRDLLMILPTGGGKSLCYQLPSLMMDGVTIVISPLLALMYDQVRALQANGINAQMISSMQDGDALKAVEQQLLAGDIKLLYIAPERLASEHFLQLLHQLTINFFVIDEAHCVSEWGHEFREDYRKLDFLKEAFPQVSIAAFTATATQKVQQDITHALRLQRPNEIRGAVFRKNLYISVEPRHKDGRSQLLAFLKNYEHDSGIVYTFTRKQTEAVSGFLQTQGIKARAYHAGLDARTRQETYRQFVHDEIQVVVATVAFGMGIDKSNIRFVVHMTLPKTIENYYQEIGRAGRDGLDAQTLLLYSVGDMIQRRELIEQLPDSPYKVHSHNQLERMIRYAGGEECRHQDIAAYFGDEIEPCAKQCDNCLHPHQDKVDVSKKAQMFLSAVYRTQQRFGQAYIIDLLRGSEHQKIRENNHHFLSVHGIGKEQSRSYWEQIAERLMESGAVARGEYRSLVLTEAGKAVLTGKKSVGIRRSRLEIKDKKEPLKANPLMENPEYFEALRLLRSEIAKEEGKPAYIIFNDKSLTDMASRLPQTKEEMLEVNGVGEVKYERFGERFLALCRELGNKE
jgi:ATP-dependent DNA helicase RecQ